MKKIIAIFLTVILSLSVINWAYAWTLEMKLYKQAIVSKSQIIREYNDGKAIVNKISEIFIQYRYEKDIESLESLEIVLKEKIIELNSKNLLSRSERKTLNIYNHIYYRTKLLLEYQL